MSSSAPKWHSAEWCVFLFIQHVTPSASCVANHWMCNCSAAPTGPAGHWHILSVPASRPVTHSGSMLSCRFQHTSCCDMKASVLIRCLQIHIQHDISSLPTSLFVALEKSDREASQLVPSVPLSSYRRAAGCAGLKGSHWCAVTKALSNCKMISDGLLLSLCNPHSLSLSPCSLPLLVSWWAPSPHLQWWK